MTDQIVIEMNEAYGEDGNAASLILNLAAAKLLASLQQDVRSDLRGRAKELADAELRVLLRDPIKQAIGQAFQPTDAFGEPKGEPKTLREVIVEEATKQLRKPDRDSYSNRRGETLVQVIVREEVQRALRAELQEAMKQARAEVMAAVREQGSEVIAETIARMARA